MCNLHLSQARLEPRVFEALAKSCVSLLVISQVQGGPSVGCPFVKSHLGITQNRIFYIHGKAAKGSWLR